MFIDPSKVRARGAWVLVKPDPPKKMSGSLYLPQGNLMERLGHNTAMVVSVGEGYYEPDDKKKKLIQIGVKPGERVVFRGHLQEANKVGKERDHCFIHAKDLVGIIPEGVELDLSLPYDN